MWVNLGTVAAGPDPLTFTANGLTGGQYYQFTVQAANIHGWGYESAVFIENSAAPPEQPDKIVTTVLNTNIKLTWIQPNNNYKTITAYQVVIWDKITSEYVVDTDLCDGSTA